MIRIMAMTNMIASIMKRGEYVSLFPKKLPALLRERVMSGYLLIKSIGRIAMSATWVISSAQNCQLLVLRAGFRLVTLADGNSSYHCSFPPKIGLWEETNIFPSHHYSIVEVVNQQRAELGIIIINPVLSGSPKVASLEQ